MELVEVEIIGQAITARYGALKTGDILRTDPAYAKHLVDDCFAARYTQASAAKPEPAAPTRNKRRTPAEMAEAAAAEKAPAEAAGISGELPI